MSTIDREREITELNRHIAQEARTPLVGYIAAGLRISLGWVFLWAFLDKAFGLGRGTPSEGAWVDGGSPTAGFLGNAVVGPFEGIYHQIAGQAWADWLFMIGLAGIGTALILGIGVRVAAVAGATLLVLMWTAVLPPENNPFMDSHLIYAGLVVLLAGLNAGRVFGLGEKWEQLELVRKNHWLR